MLLGAGAVALGACGGGKAAPPPAGGSSATGEDASYAEPGGGSVAEAERTRAMQERADQMERDLAAARAGGATGEDAVKAWEKYEAERAELNRQGEGAPPEGEAAAPAEGDSYEPPPPGP
jgi:hypothetical protein